jgi:BlaI family transcriptional regulator, penicillinase repressor
LRLGQSRRIGWKLHSAVIWWDLSEDLLELIDELLRHMSDRSISRPEKDLRQRRFMARNPTPHPTDVELQILEVLWQRGPSTVRQVHDALAADRATGYSTTLKMMQVMREKGLLVRDDMVRPQLYEAAHDREQTQSQMVDDLIHKAFRGSAKKLLIRVLSSNRVLPEELAEIQCLIQQARRNGKDLGDAK